MSDTLPRLRQDYAVALLRYLSQRDEAGLSSAYEVGREGLTGGVSLLDVVRIHHEVLLEVLRAARSAEETRELADAAATFQVEALASFDLARRGFMEDHVSRGRRRRSR
jgi:hypothetical protein